MLGFYDYTMLLTFSSLVSASIGIGRELYLLSEDGILYRVAYSRYVYGDDVLSGYIKTGLQIEEVLTNVRLP